MEQYYKVTLINIFLFCITIDDSKRCRAVEDWNYRLSGWKFLYHFDKFFHMPSIAHVLTTFFPSNFKTAHTWVLLCSLHDSYFTTYYSSLVKAFKLLSALVFPLFVLSSLSNLHSLLLGCMPYKCL